MKLDYAVFLWCLSGGIAHPVQSSIELLVVGDATLLGLASDEAELTL